MATYQSLYRRYRSQRFDEVLGQDHITRALRNAVREGRVGHAYLFSGPRGTGKTSTARILAKVLNCANPQDGEPCGACDNCVAVAEGRVTDWLLEQDAASKSKVDDMRDLLERVPLGTSGNRKVIILDEVHMLSQGAENALLKTLEEPPDHVIFVLATTDPQKVRPTIRSRTQHFDFHLLPTDVLSDHVRHVIDDAGLGLGDDAVEHVVRVGGGSARDTLSALDQVAALGEVVTDTEPVDAVIDALCDRDAGAALVAVADALSVGRDPRTLGEEVIAGLRNAFLAVMGVGDLHLAPADRARAADVGARLGAAALTRALEVLGEALTELARKPDPRIVVEVAFVRLTRVDTDRSLDAILERLDRLERGLPAAPGRGGGTTPDGAPPSTPSEPAGEAPSATTTPSVDSARAVLAARRGSVPKAGPKSKAKGKARAGDDGVPSAGDAPGTPAPPAEAGPTASSTAGSTAKGTPTLGAVARRGGGKRASASAAPGADDTPDGSTADVGATAAGAEPAAARAGAGTAGTAGAGAGAEPAAPRAGAGTAGTAGAVAGTDPGAAGTGAGASGDGGLTIAQVDGAWQGVLAGLPISVRSKWRAGRWVESDGGFGFAVDNEWHQKVCDDTRRDVEQALVGHFGQPVTVSVVVEGAASGGRGGASGGGGSGGSGRSGASGRDRSTGAATGAATGGGGGPASGPGPDDIDEHIDPSELRDAGDVTVGGVDLLLREFGGELVEGEQR